MTNIILAESPTGGTGILGAVSDWAISIMETLGSVGAGVAVALENVFPPIPSEVILPLAGFTASRGDLSLAGAIIWTTIGSTVGALMWYYVGVMLGRDRTRRLVARVPLVKLADVDRTEQWFSRHGVKAVFFGRMVPIVRSFISIPAGIERMSVLTFTLFTALGSMIWNVIFIMAGYLLGENWPMVEKYVDLYQKGIIALAAVAVAAFVVVRVRSARRRGVHR
jgi:membrane protein DedA with SNARE-associated domain